jgi:hypothetical protein
VDPPLKFKHLLGCVSACVPSPSCVWWRPPASKVPCELSFPLERKLVTPWESNADKGKVFVEIPLTPAPVLQTIWLER